MESVPHIRSFRWTDLTGFTHLFNELYELSDTERANDTELMRQFLSQPGCDPERNCFVAESAGSLIGFALITPELAIGRTVAGGGVLKSHRHQGLGRKLIRKTEEHASDLGASLLHVSTGAESGPAHGVLETEGFQQVRRYWQMRWEPGAVQTVQIPEGFALRSFHLGLDEEALTRLQNAAFADSWGFCPNSPEEISARVRFKRCDPEGILIITDDKGMSAYNWTFRVSNERGATGWIAMTGVHPDYRGLGLGTVVVSAGLEYLRAKGVTGVELEVDAANGPARELYLGLGFRKVAETVWYEARLN